jgi:serine/threonine protein kinase
VGEGVHGGHRGASRIEDRHADLKPANAYLIADPSLEAGYQLKLIDTDFSLLADRRAPWHGYQGYVGSDNYRSPEHMTRGEIPTLESDIFTCGLILHELLAGVHPYWREDQAEYAKLVREYKLAPPALLWNHACAREQRDGQRLSAPLPFPGSEITADSGDDPSRTEWPRPEGCHGGHVGGCTRARDCCRRWCSRSGKDGLRPPWPPARRCARTGSSSLLQPVDLCG